MTEHFSFFDAIQDSNGHYDREYNAQQFTDYFKSLVTTGVMKGAYNQLEVTANGSNMTSSVKSGVAFVEGRYYYNDALLQLTHDTEVLGLSRIDRIVVRMDLSTEARYVKTFIKKGVPAASPVPPILTQTTQLYEISLAQVMVIGGQTFISSDAVTDERGKSIVCPWAGSKILPNFNDDALEDLLNDVEILNSVIDLKADKTLETPIAPTLINGWQNGTPGVYIPVKYYKDSFGLVHIQGSAVNPNKTFQPFTLPVGYRPMQTRAAVPCELWDASGNSLPGALVIYNDGRVTVTNPNCNAFNVSGHFRIDM